MSEKRFTVDKVGIYDNQEKKQFKFTAYDWIDCDIYECCKVMNEQESTIDKLDQENADLLGARIKAQEEWEKCTDKLKEKILEQQATIHRDELSIKTMLTNMEKLEKENSELRQKLKKYEDKEFERTQMRGW